MRNYLYIWNDQKHQAIVVSGLEFKDLLPVLNLQDGIILIEHKSDIEEYDNVSGFNYCESNSLHKLVDEDIYSWGDFVWADYKTQKNSPMSEAEVSELLYFAHKKKPLHKTNLPSINNKFLCHIHDDGWFMKLYYANWKNVEELLSKSIPANLGSLNIQELKKGNCGFWLSLGNVCEEEKTYDIDSILTRRL